MEAIAYEAERIQIQGVVVGQLEAINKDSWPRIIALVDMNSFFASIEQMDYPELYGRPVGVTNGLQGTCIITCSYEARSWGIKTGMRLKEAKKLCLTSFRGHPGLKDMRKFPPVSCLRSKPSLLIWKSSLLMRHS